MTDARELLWQPSQEAKAAASITRYANYLTTSGAGPFDSYQDLWSWSVRQLPEFWASIWDFFDITASQPYRQVLTRRQMPGAGWFDGSTLNFAEHLVRLPSASRPAILYAAEDRPLAALSWQDLMSQAAGLAATLREAGIRAGDRVVSALPNIPEAVVAFIATASIGAIWSNASPEFGNAGLLDRFAQIEPSFLFCCDGYRYGGRTFDRTGVVRELQSALPSLRGTVLVPVLGGGTLPPGKTLRWDDAVRNPAADPLLFEQVPFEHPLWIVYTSGTSGPPKAIVHGHGGVLLERLKATSLHLDVRPGDVFFWYTTTGWVMWNLLVSALLSGATIVLYDGSPKYPDFDTLWALAEQSGATLFGASAAFIGSCIEAGLRPGADHDLSQLRAIGSTAAPLSSEGYRWVYAAVKRDVLLASSSGGTDVATAFVGSCPVLPVYAGEMQCRCLGVDVHAFDERGRSVTGEVGELVVTQPMPSMPLYFWGDKEGARYTDSYFARYPGVWCHGDSIRITTDGYSVISGRSDSTINRQGIRIGTSEVYRVVEAMPEVADSLVVEIGGAAGIGGASGASRMELFIVTAPGFSLDDDLAARIRRELGEQLSPRHTPDGITAIPAVPRTLTGKKLEIPVKRVLMGAAVEEAVTLASVANPEALGAFASPADRRL
jgi:acetoacetyl-CoA synthetase